MTTKKLRRLNIVDVNNLLYIGNHRFSNYSVTDINGNKIKTGGMYMVMNLLRRRIYHHTADMWIFCFDKKSFRKELAITHGIDYKTGRGKMPAHLIIQAKELLHWLPQIGYNVMAVEGLEADDCINSIVDLLKDQPLQINIISTDRDLSFNVSDTCSVVSSNLRVPTITRENYETTVGKRGHFVHYNSVLLYKVICGDTSDGILPITKEPYALYRKVCKRLSDAGLDLSQLKDPEVLEKTLTIFSGELYEKAYANWQLVKPYILPPEAIQLKSQQINKEKLYEFCSLFGMKSIANKFGITLTEYPEFVTKYRIELYKQTIQLDSNQTLGEDISKTSEEENENGEDGLERIKIINSFSEQLNDVGEIFKEENNISNLTAVSISEDKDVED